MAAPEFVPVPPGPTRSYSSPDRRDGSWMADRPGELTGRQPVGPQFGSPGPDQGYVIQLAATVAGTLRLATGEHEADALAAVGAVALKRASAFGRAPVIHDVRAAVAVLGLAEGPPDGEVGERRRMMLEEVHHPHAYSRLRAVADLVAEEALARPLEPITADGAVVSW